MQACFNHNDCKYFILQNADDVTDYVGYVIVIFVCYNVSNLCEKPDR
jgi:hypothetical protein